MENQIKELLESYIPLTRELEQLNACFPEDAEKQKDAAEIKHKLETIEQLIDDLPPSERVVLRYHYLLGLTWEETAQRTYWCDRHIYRVRDSAIARLAACHRMTD